mgnify:CR=1 FL=1|jgi:hypothetical protein
MAILLSIDYEIHSQLIVVNNLKGIYMHDGNQVKYFTVGWPKTNNFGILGPKSFLQF